MLVACWCQAALACCGMLWHAVACCGDACGDACGAESTTACDATTPHPTRDKPVHAQAACRATRARNTPHVTRISSAVPGGNGHLSLAHLPGPMPHSHNKHHLASNHTYTHTEEQSWTRLRAFSVACVSLPTPQDTHTHTHAHAQPHVYTNTRIANKQCPLAGSSGWQPGAAQHTCSDRTDAARRGRGHLRPSAGSRHARGRRCGDAPQWNAAAGGACGGCGGGVDVGYTGSRLGWWNLQAGPNSHVPVCM